MGISILFNPIKSEWDDPGILLGYMYVGGPINLIVVLNVWQRIVIANKKKLRKSVSTHPKPCRWAY